MADTRQFYDHLAADYHLNYADWDNAVRRQGRMLADLIRSQNLDGEACTVLDCSCGIGTQAIGLALEGFDVFGTDLSPASIARARREADRFGVTVIFAEADMRHVAQVVSGSFDVVISCDNSLPHLMTDDDMRLALGNMHAKLRPGGRLIVGIRDYDALLTDRPRLTPPQVRELADQRSVVFQLWDWSEDATTYRLTMFVHKQHGHDWQTDVHVAEYRALRRDDVDLLVGEAGFSGIQWRFPEMTGHHQPVMTAIRPHPESGT